MVNKLVLKTTEFELSALSLCQTHLTLINVSN